jgi:hypothetical protein
MKNKAITSSFIFLLIILSGCSHTPGDAAVRAGRPQAGADLYLEGAKLGHADAALKLGLLLEEGRAVPSTRLPHTGSDAPANLVVWRAVTMLE